MDLALTALLKLAQLAGFNSTDLAAHAAQAGLSEANAAVRTHFRETWEAAIPGILSNLETKAPLDGQRRKDKDGIEMSDVEFLLHEADYSLWKAVLLHGGAVPDGFRDAHIVKVWPMVPAIPGETREALLGRLVAAEMELTF